jgi:hypothetical protein
MANHNLPTLSSTYTNFLGELDARLDDLAVGLDPAATSATNVPTNSIRWNSSLKTWQKYNGTTSEWVALTDSYAINISGSSSSSTQLFSSVLEYGAVADGITINDTAFQTMESSSEQLFYVPEGDYKITLNNLNKQYLGPGRIIYGDNVIQDCNFESRSRQRNETGPLEIESPSDILLKPVGTVNTNGKRISGIGIAAGQNDALSPAAMTSGVINGVKLTNQVSTDANTLDWYQEGTFTPDVRGTTTAGTATYPGLRYGRYTRIGDQCRVRVRVQYSVTGSAGPIVVSNLPFPASSTSSIAGGLGAGFVQNFTFTGQLTFYAIGNYLYALTFSSGGSPSNPIDTAGEIDVDITYFIE